MADYTGKISNAGTQIVEAPIKPAAPKGGKVQTGKDLRTK